MMKDLWRKLILDSGLPHVVTLIGGGGKTSLMYYLLRILKDKNCAAVAVTTTKLSSQALDGNCFVEIKSIEAGHQAVKKSRASEHNVTLVYGQDQHDTNKMLGIPSAWIKEFAVADTEMVFVVEGDGSAGKSLKGHLHHEPVIADCSSLVIVVIGSDSVGTQLNSQNVHRPERISQLTKAKKDSLVTIEMVTQLLFHSQGYLHNCPSDSKIILFINKVESRAECRQAVALARDILAHKHPQIVGVMVGSVRTEEGLWLQQSF